MRFCYSNWRYNRIITTENKHTSGVMSRKQTFAATRSSRPSLSSLDLFIITIHTPHDSYTTCNDVHHSLVGRFVKMLVQVMIIPYARGDQVGWGFRTTQLSVRHVNYSTCASCLHINKSHEFYGIWVRCLFFYHKCK